MINLVGDISSIITVIFMRLFFIYLIFFGFLLNPINADPKLDDLKIIHLNGNIKSLMETRYLVTAKGKSLEKEKAFFQKLTLFDPFGYITETILFQDGTEYLISKYTFDSEGKPSEMNQYFSDNSLNLNVVYKYNKDTLRSEAIFTWSENLVFGDICEMYDYYYDILLNHPFNLVAYQYEYRGYCTEEKFIKPDGGTSFKFINKYDFRGNKLESAYFKGGNISWLTKYTYDRYGNLTESRVFKDNRIAVQSYYKHQYDDKKNWISRLEEREVFVNILTAGLVQSDILTERIIEYY